MKETVSYEAREDQWEISEEFVSYTRCSIQKERFVIFKEERVGGRARVTIDEERVL